MADQWTDLGTWGMMGAPPVGGAAVAVEDFQATRRADWVSCRCLDLAAELVVVS